ncbi:MAG TPA: PAS domain S-box protein [Blastocatellia bacterium]|nr:PAS domain S-box protein [Blastocatellia bacterium]
MDAALHVLIAEDRPADAKLMLHALRRAGFEVVAHCVETEVDFLAHLRPDLDVILSDYSMQQFDAERALMLVKRSGLDVPFIVVTGTISETVAVEMMKKGAADYLLKDRLSRLGEAVRRACYERELKRANQQADAALRESRERLEAIITSAMDAIITVDEDQRITLFNAAAERLFGCRAAAALGRPISEFIPERVQVAAANQRQPTAASGAGAAAMPRLLYACRANGETFPAETSISQSVVGARRFSTIILRDASDRQRATEALRQSEERYRRLFESTPQPMWVYDKRTFAFLAVNPAAVRRYGYTAEEFLAMTIADIRPAADLGPLHEHLANGLQDDWATVWRHRKKDGTVIEVEILSHDLEFEGRAARLVLATDVTERRSLEAQLRQAQKMEAIGRLAGGVAHDFNNLLTAILGYSQLLMAQVGPASKLRRELEEIYKAGTRAASLTSQLLAFSRKQVVQPVSLDLNVVVTDMGKMLQRLIGEDIELRFELASDLDFAEADASQMQQVVMNLVINARDAMPQGGQLTIATANVELDEAYNGPRIAAGAYVMLRVSDTGSGIPEEVRLHIFEPFFTTKDKDKGTGLGLSMVHRIVTESGGHICFESVPGQGTTFEVYLPRHAPRQEVGAGGAVMAETLGGTETILLVEDEDAVRRLAASVLKASGYTVLEARHCDEALRLATAHRGQINLLVTDVVMPQMSGRELAEHLTGLSPELKVLYMSGYMDDAIVHHGVLEPDSAFLQKPFMPDAFARKVREVLAK